MRVVVIPCFNEGARLDDRALLAFAVDDVHLLLVDDGSDDDTLVRLQALATLAPNRVEVLVLPSNQGKAEAVRRGLLQAVEAGADVVGYLDADLSTPTTEMTRLLDVLVAQPSIEVVLGARVALLGRQLERSQLRHYLGRIFASAAATGLGVAVYDTQCGAKAFRVTPSLRRALARPFTSRWAFDVELLGRLLHTVPVDAFEEVPLLQWRDVKGGSLRPWSMARAGLDVLVIGARHRLKLDR